MRHYLAQSLPLAIAPLPVRVVQAALKAGLETLPGGEEAGPTGGLSAALAAVTLAPVAPGAEEEDLAARLPPADHESQRIHASLAGREDLDGRRGSCDHRGAGSRPCDSG